MTITSKNHRRCHRVFHFFHGFVSSQQFPEGIWSISIFLGLRSLCILLISVAVLLATTTACALTPPMLILVYWWGSKGKSAFGGWACSQFFGELRLLIRWFFFMCFFAQFWLVKSVVGGWKFHDIPITRMSRNVRNLDRSNTSDLCQHTRRLGMIG